MSGVGLEIQKIQKNQKNKASNQMAGGFYLELCFFVCFCFFWISRGVWGGLGDLKTTKNKKKTKIQIRWLGASI
jgi:hypothetical protein